MSWRGPGGRRDHGGQGTTAERGGLVGRPGRKGAWRVTQSLDGWGVFLVGVTIRGDRGGHGTTAKQEGLVGRPGGQAHHLPFEGVVGNGAPHPAVLRGAGGGWPPGGRGTTSKRVAWETGMGGIRVIGGSRWSGNHSRARGLVGRPGAGPICPSRGGWAVGFYPAALEGWAGVDPRWFRDHGQAGAW